MPKVKDKGQGVPRDHPYGEMTIKLLKEQLKKRGAKVSGRKADLVSRLESYDRNANFGQGSQDMPAFNMELPEPSTFKDINTDSEIPDIRESTVRGYLELFGQQLQKKILTMYDERFLLSMRHSYSGQETWVCGRVSAEMKKRVVYRVDIKFDVHQAISETQCECGAGMGPNAHCKHVALVLYALTKHKEGIITQETCTQILQTFHQVKKYNGSPVKTENLALRKKKKISDLPGYEPRQIQLEHKKYNQLFDSVWRNSSGKNIPIRHGMAPANILALCHDHDYFQETPEDHFLQVFKVTSMSDEERQILEKHTRNQSTCKLWHNERAKRLQASNYHRICTATDRTDKSKLARGYTIPGKNIISAPLVHGKKYEEKAINTYEKETGSKVIASGIMVHPDKPFLGCSPDGLVDDEGIIEIKCPYTSRFETPDETSVPYLVKGENDVLSLRKSHQYYYQVMGTLLCTRRKWCDFMVWTYKGSVIIRIDRDEQFIQEITSKLTEFFRMHFKDALLYKYMYERTVSYTFD